MARCLLFFFFSSRRRHTSLTCDWSSDVCSSDLGIAAFWTLLGREEDASASLRMGVTLGLIACVLQLFPTGDRQGKLVARHQPVALAAMEAVFEGGPAAPLAIIGQPNVDAR